MVDACSSTAVTGIAHKRAAARWLRPSGLPCGKSNAGSQTPLANAHCIDTYPAAGKNR